MSRNVFLAVALGLWVSATPAQRLFDQCPAVKQLAPRGGSADIQPCEMIATLRKIASECAASLPADAEMQRRAARILVLEREQKIKTMVFEGFRQTHADPKRMRDLKVDPEMLGRRIADHEKALAKLAEGLARERRSALAAGYAGFAETDFAQRVLANYAWRHVEDELRRVPANCADAAGVAAARDVAGNLLARTFHGSAPLERDLIHRILGLEGGMYEHQVLQRILETAP